MKGRRVRSEAGRLVAVCVLSGLLLPLWLSASVQAAEDGRRGQVVAGAPAFRERNVFDAEATLRYFDMGCADVDADGRLDVFTSNHSDLQGLWLNRGGWIFAPGLNELSLHQDSKHPGLESLPGRAIRERDALQVYWQRRRLILATQSLSAPKAYDLKLSFYGGYTIKRNDGFTIGTTETSGTGDFARTSLQLGVPRTGTLDIHFEVTSAPMEIDFEHADARRRVRVGRGGAITSESQIRFALRDRHGMAWSRVDGDDELDVFIARGGLKGQMAGAPFEVQDELLLQKPSGFVDARAAFGLKKPVGRTRKVRWLDFDRDGRLDLLMTSLDFPLSIWLRRGDRFVQAPASGLESIRSPIIGVLESPGAWPRFLAEKDGALALYEKKGEQYGVRERFHVVGEPLKILVADANGDGALDALVLASDHMSLLVADGESFDVVSDRALGLPVRAGAGAAAGAGVGGQGRRGGHEATDASWVDYDNDGDLDLFLYPAGLFAQEPGLRFRADPALMLPIQGKGSEGHSAWADFDEDGDLDLALAAQSRSAPRTWRMLAYENQLPSRQWLQVDLVGGPGNREAIGARVDVVAGERRLSRWVGDAESSVYSQGHYRVYFGLASHQGPISLSVIWPDGELQSVADVRMNSLVRVVRAEK